jgi:hypothetical protein
MARTRISILSTLASGVTGWAAIARTIFVKPGVEKLKNSASGRPWNVTTGRHGRVTAPATNSPPGTFSSMTHPTASARSEMIFPLPLYLLTYLFNLFMGIDRFRVHDMSPIHLGGITIKLDAAVCHVRRGAW